ncbi:MAG: hypothetical protein ACYCST_12505 [Acidimicrobiales bacterium]
MTTSSDRFPGAPGPRSCELLASAAAELALGSLMGTERSWALAHLDGCDGCATLVADLASAADGLMLIAPAADPPPGFEVRWLNRVRADRSDSTLPAARAKRSRARRTTASQQPAGLPWTTGAGERLARVTRLRPRALVAAGVAALALALVGSGVGVGAAISARNPGQSPTTAQVRLAALRPAPLLVARGDTASGEVAIIAGSPSWVVMNYRQPGWSGRVTCVVIADGHEQEIGSFWIYDGSGSWTVRLASSGGAVSSAEVRSLSGAVLAKASFVN